MFEFLRDNPKYIVYWCYSKQRKYSLSEIGEDHLVKIGSIRNYVLYYLASFVLFSHSNSSDIAPTADSFSLRHPFRVHISHGVEGLKRSSKKIIEADLYTCTSDFELDIKHKEWNIPLKNTAVTGVARFDNYSTKIHQKEDNIESILYLPTWRDWDYRLNSTEFKSTRYYQEIDKLIHSKDLLQILKLRQIHLYIQVHPFVSKFFRNYDEALENDYIKFVDNNISKLIINTDVLITDYSSIAMDFFYQYKPVIFYQYDQEEFLRYRGSYLDYDNELFGKISKNMDDLIRQIKIINFESSLNYPELRAKLFSYFDKNNSQRILTAVEKKLEFDLS